MRALHAVPLAVALVLWTAAARAQSQSATATELFDAGRDLMKQGRYAEACPKLSESARLDAKVGTLARLAECDEALGHLADALAHWQQALNLAQAQADDRLEHVRSELARVDHVVPKLRLSSAAAPPTGLVVRVDAVQVTAAGFDVPVPVNPGTHTVTAAAPGKKSWLTSVETKADGATTSVSIPALEDEPLPSQESPARERASAPPEASHGNGLRMAGIVAGAAGVVVLGFGAGFGIASKSKLDQSNAPGGCVGNRCPQAAADTRNAARSDGDVSTVLFIAGGVLVAGGVTLWLVAPRQATHDPSSTAGGGSLSLALVPGLGAMTLRGSF